VGNAISRDGIRIREGSTCPRTIQWTKFEIVQLQGGWGGRLSKTKTKGSHAILLERLSRFDIAGVHGRR